MKAANDMSSANTPDKAWVSPDSAGSTAQADPGDGVPISQAHILKADSIFPPLMEMLRPLLRADSAGRAVIGICGGSGSGKSGTAAVIAQPRETRSRAQCKKKWHDREQVTRPIEERICIANKVPGFGNEDVLRAW